MIHSLGPYNSHTPTCLVLLTQLLTLHVLFRFMNWRFLLNPLVLLLKDRTTHFQFHLSCISLLQVHQLYPLHLSAVCRRFHPLHLHLDSF